MEGYSSQTAQPASQNCDRQQPLSLVRQPAHQPSEEIRVQASESDPIFQCVTDLAEICFLRQV
jgi:hypothetical protein